MTYDIGYKRPPPDKQFKKGQSGNPAGRPKGSSNLATLIRQEVTQKISVQIDGKKKTMSKLHLIAKQVVAGATKGNRKDLVLMVDIMRRESGTDQNDTDTVIPENHEEYLKKYLQQVTEMGVAPNTDADNNDHQKQQQ